MSHLEQEGSPPLSQAHTLCLTSSQDAALFFQTQQRWSGLGLARDGSLLARHLHSSVVDQILLASSPARHSFFRVTSTRHPHSQRTTNSKSTDQGREPFSRAEADPSRTMCRAEEAPREVLVEDDGDRKGG